MEYIRITNMLNPEELKQKQLSHLVQTQKKAFEPMLKDISRRYHMYERERAI